MVRRSPPRRAVLAAADGGLSSGRSVPAPRGLQPMSLVFDIGTGRRPGYRHRRAPVPAAAAGGRAGARRHRHRLRRQRLAVPGEPGVPAGRPGAGGGGLPGRARRGGPAHAAGRRRRSWPSCSARCCSPARWRRATGPPAGAASWAACSARRWRSRAVGGLLERAAKRLDDSAAGLLLVYADVAALVLAAIAIFLPPVAFLALVALVVLLVRGQRRRRREVRRPADPAVSAAASGPRKLVLAVIDALAPEGLEQAIEDDRAPDPGAADARRALRAPTACPRSPRSRRWRRRRSPPASGPTATWCRR